MRRFLYTVGALGISLILVGQGCISLSGSGTGTSGPAGMFVTTNKGDSWTQISLEPTVEGVKKLEDVSVYRIEEDPQDPKAMYWVTRENGMYYTYDEGRSWTHVEGPLATGFIYSTAVDPTDKCNIYGTNGVNIYKSEDCNRTWQEIYRESSTEDRVIAITFSKFAPHDIYMAKSGGDVLKSEDGGKNWRVLNRFKTRLSYLGVDPLEKNVLYVASRTKGLYRSVDDGKTWEYLKEGMSDFSKAGEFRRFAFHPTKVGTIYWISRYGILESSNRGDTWKAMDLIHPPGSANIFGFVINPKNDKEIFYTATLDNRSTFYRTEDGGANWTTKKLPSGQIPTVLRLNPENPELLYIGFTIPPKE